jgi:hypothetical protein
MQIVTPTIIELKISYNDIFYLIKISHSSKS